MAITSELIILLKTRDEASAGVISVRKELSGLEKGVASVKSSWLAYTAAIAGVIYAGKQIVDGISSVVNAGAAEQQIIDKMANALANQGISYQSVSKEIRDYASQLQATTQYSDDQVMSSFTRLVQGGFSYKDALTSLSAATNLATAKNMDLESASTLLIRAHGGMTASLSRYGLIVEKGTTQQATYKNVLSEIERLMGGSAQAAVQSYAGQMVILNHQLDDLKESIGNAIIPVIMQLIPVIKQVILDIKNWVESAKGIAIIQNTINILMIAFEGLVGAGKIVWEVLKFIVNSIKDMVVLVGSFASAIGNLLTGNFASYQAYSEKMWESIKNIGTNVGQLVTGTIGGVANAMELKLIELEAKQQNYGNNTIRQQQDIANLSKEELGKREKAENDLLQKKKSIEKEMMDYVVENTFTKRTLMTREMNEKIQMAKDAGAEETTIVAYVTEAQINIRKQGIKEIRDAYTQSLDVLKSNLAGVSGALNQLGQLTGGIVVPAMSNLASAGSDFVGALSTGNPLGMIEAGLKGINTIVGFIGSAFSRNVEEINAGTEALKRQDAEAKRIKVEKEIADAKTSEQQKLLKQQWAATQQSQLKESVSKFGGKQYDVRTEKGIYTMSGERLKSAVSQGALTPQNVINILVSGNWVSNEEAMKDLSKDIDLNVWKNKLNLAYV